MATSRNTLRQLVAGMMVISPIVLGAQTTSVVVVGVADAATGAPLTDARVRVPEANRAGTTNWIGEAFIPGIKAGRHTVEARKLGYEPGSVDVLVRGDSVGVVFRLIRVTPSLDTVVIRGVPVPWYLEEFERRRQGAFGRFLVAAQLDSLWNETVADVAARRFPGLRVEWVYPREFHLVSTHAATFLNKRCVPDVYVDRIYRRDDEVLALAAGEVAGIEYYSIAPPVQYQRLGQECGAILIWTKR